MKCLSTKTKLLYCNYITLRRSNPQRVFLIFKFLYYNVFAGNNGDSWTIALLFELRSGLSARMIRENFADFLFARFYVALAPKNNPNKEK